MQDSTVTACHQMADKFTQAAAFARVMGHHFQDGNKKRAEVSFQQMLLHLDYMEALIAQVQKEIQE